MHSPATPPPGLVPVIGSLAQRFLGSRGRLLPLSLAGRLLLRVGSAAVPAAVTSPPRPAWAGPLIVLFGPLHLASQKAHGGTGPASAQGGEVYDSFGYTAAAHTRGDGRVGRGLLGADVYLVGLAALTSSFFFFLHRLGRTPVSWFLGQRFLVSRRGQLLDPVKIQSARRLTELSPGASAPRPGAAARLRHATNTVK